MDEFRSEYLTMDDFDFDDKTVLLRLDLNSPIHPITGEIMGDQRFHSHVKTINSLKDSKVVIMAHQSRPGKDDFTSLRDHARRLEKILGRKVTFVDSLFGHEATKQIDAMKSGDILMLENTRFYSEDVTLDTSDMDTVEKTNMVRILSQHVDYFINDAFPAIHRDQVSLTGFTRKMPNVMGRLIEDEIRALYSFTRKNDGDKIAILAGAKIEDSIKVSESFLNNDITSYICVGGVVANAFMWASGMKIGKKNEDFIIKNNKNHDKLIKKCADLLKKHKERIIMPVDFILNPSKVRINMEDSIPYDQILADIGPDSIALFTEKIRSAASIFINGPMGMYEMSGYQSGTYEILGEIARSKGLTIAGGGHTISAIGILGVGKQIDHISTGGGALISYLSGEPMPVLEALKKSKQFYEKGE